MHGGIVVAETKVCMVEDYSYAEDKWQGYNGFSNAFVIAGENILFEFIWLR